MIGDITLGQYFPGNSILHKMDARMKIILTIIMMTSIFICKSFWALGILLVTTILVILISQINIKTILKGIKPILVIVIFTTLLNLFYGSGEPIIHIGFIKITELGIYNAIFMAFRIMTLVVFGLMLTYTTTPTSLTDAMESLLKPLKLLHIDVHSIAMTMTIALRFIPTLIEEVDKIMSAQKSRGADMENGGLIKRVKAVVPIMIPLFVSSFRRANELAYAMECRCYRGGDGRTKMNKMRLKALDYVSLFVTLLYFAGIIVIRIFVNNVI